MIEVKAGYKQTEIGVILDDWDVVVFENIADKTKKWGITGGPFGSNLKTSDYTNDGVQIIQLQNIGDGNFIDDNHIFTSEEKANELLSCNIYPDEIILSKMGDPVARACFIPNKSNRYLMASDGIRLVVNETEFSKKFIHDYINSIYFRKRAFEISTGSTRLRIGLPELKTLLVIKPPKSEQSAIATIFSDTDALIERLEKLIAKKKAIKQGTMQQLLTGKKRLPGFEQKKSYKRTEVGVIPVDWVVNQIGKYAKLINGRAYALHEWETQGIPVIRLQNLTGSGENYYYSNLKLPEKQYCDFGDLLFMWSATFGPVIWKGEKAIYHYHIWKIETYQNKLDKLFLFYVLSDLTGRVEKSSTNGGTMLHVTKKSMEETLIPLPTPSEQSAIATILSDMDTEIEALKQTRDKYTMIKQGMMQQLLTGRIRINGTN